MKNKKILYLTAEGFDSPNCVNHLVFTLCEHLLLKNYKLKLIQSRKTGIQPDIPTGLSQFSQFGCITIPRTNVNKLKFVRRYLNELKYHIKTIKYYRKDKDIDCAIIQSSPSVVWQILFMKIFLRKPIIYNLYDVFPGSSYSTGSIRPKALYLLMQTIQKIAYKLSNHIIVISKDMKNILMDLGVPEEKMSIIVNWYDDRQIKEVAISDNKFVNKYNLLKDVKEKFILQFAGTIGTVFDYNVVLNVAKELETHKDIIFHIIGDGAKLDEFKEHVKKNKITNIIFFPWQPLEIIADVYSYCDVGFIPLKRGVIGNGVPSKASLLMGCKKPIINAVEDSTYSNMINNNQIGFAIDQDNIASIVEKILALYNDNGLYNIYANNAKKFGIKNYSSSANVFKFEQVIKKVCKDGDK